MLEILITFLNSRIATTGYINNILCLAEIIEREKTTYPAIPINVEYKRIELDPRGSLSYWRKNGDVSYTQQENKTKVGLIEFTTKVPLKLICFVKKDSGTINSYFADNMVEALKSLLSTNTAILNTALKSKKTSIIATKHKTNGIDVAKDEYTGIDYEPRYTHAYFSIDFEIEIISNQNCFNDICDINWTNPTPSELISFCTRVENCQLLFQKIELSSQTDNIIFTFANEPIQVFVNGLLQNLGTTYSQSGNVITFASALFDDDLITAYGNF